MQNLHQILPRIQDHVPRIQDHVPRIQDHVHVPPLHIPRPKYTSFNERWEKFYYNCDGDFVK